MAVTWPKDTDASPVDADVDAGRGFLAPRQVQVASARAPAADEHGVVALLQQRAHRLDALAARNSTPRSRM
jgi:hypothetical protein